MADDKQFEASASRIEKAKREGDVARSQELGGAVAFAGGLGGVALVAGPLSAVAAGMLRAAATGHTIVPEFASATALMLVPAACSCVAACAASAAQSGGIRLSPVSVKPERLHPGENLKRILSRETAVTAVRALVAVAAAAAAIVPVFLAIVACAIYSGDLRAIASIAWTGALRTCAVAAVIGAIFAGADLAVQLARWRKRLRMSREELKRDQKEQEGDPHARSRRRSLHRQIARGSLSKVKDAAFVVTNPTHIAIALEYAPPRVPVPRLLVRAADESAARVRELAAAHGVPVIEHVQLARALYASARPGDFIPKETYVAVAEVVIAVTRALTPAAGRPPE